LEKREMFLHDRGNAILKARQEGRQEGLQQGLQEGDRQARMAIARELLEVLDLETLSQKTGLSIEEIQQLRA
jgi:predicted transposase/invertase (TIGR01784 family)